MAKNRREKKRDLSHHTRYGFEPVAFTEPETQGENIEKKAPPIQAAVQVSGEAAYLKRELGKVFVILCLIAISFVVLSSMIGKLSWLDSFISGLKIG